MPPVCTTAVVVTLWPLASATTSVTVAANGDVGGGEPEIGVACTLFAAVIDWQASVAVMLPSAVSVLLAVPLVTVAAFGIGGGRRDRDRAVLQAGSDSRWWRTYHPFVQRR